MTTNNPYYFFLLFFFFFISLLKKIFFFSSPSFIQWFIPRSHCRNAFAKLYLVASFLSLDFLRCPQLSFSLRQYGVTVRNENARGEWIRTIHVTGKMRHHGVTFDLTWRKVCLSRKLAHLILVSQTLGAQFIFSSSVRESRLARVPKRGTEPGARGSGSRMEGEKMLRKVELRSWVYLVKNASLVLEGLLRRFWKRNFTPNSRSSHPSFESLTNL